MSAIFHVIDLRLHRPGLTSTKAQGVSRHQLECIALCANVVQHNAPAEQITNLGLKAAASWQITALAKMQMHQVQVTSAWPQSDFAAAYMLKIQMTQTQTQKHEVTSYQYTALMLLLRYSISTHSEATCSHQCIGSVHRKPMSEFTMEEGKLKTDHRKLLNGHISSKTDRYYCQFIGSSAQTPDQLLGMLIMKSTQSLRASTTRTA